jgi:hypothetical protein
MKEFLILDDYYNFFQVFKNMKNNITKNRSYVKKSDIVGIEFKHNIRIYLRGNYLSYTFPNTEKNLYVCITFLREGNDVRKND